MLHRPVELAQYTSVHFGETLSLSGLLPSIGSVGDAFDNALAETTIGLYKTECVRVDSPFRRGPLRTLSDVELITADYVGWYNQQRLIHRLGRVPPAEAEARYYATQHVTDQPAGSQIPRVHETREASHSPDLGSRLACAHPGQGAAPMIDPRRGSHDWWRRLSASRPTKVVGDGDGARRSALLALGIDVMFRDAGWTVVEKARRLRA